MDSTAVAQIPIRRNAAPAALDGYGSFPFVVVVNRHGGLQTPARSACFSASSQRGSKASRARSAGAITAWSAALGYGIGRRGSPTWQPCCSSAYLTQAG